ncbi:MAG: SDR family oxidoreductase [Thermoproteota archaeon]|nr:SDR family oxidoreductase [Thermoproteota archaeon]
MDKSTGENKSKPSLDDKTTIVTGGGRGIGAAICKLLAERGANIVVNYMSNKESADKVASEIRETARTRNANIDALAVQADVRNTAQVQNMVDETIRKYGQIDILVNNAAVARYELKPFLETTWDDFAERFNDEMKAAYNVTRAVLPGMIERHYGKLIYITSGSARYTMPNGAIAFASAKSALVTFSRYIAQEFGRQRITANVIAPGLTETDANVYMPQEAKQQMASLSAIGRLGKPEDVARAVAFAASDDSNFVTGTYIPVDGGFVLVG